MTTADVGSTGPSSCLCKGDFKRKTGTQICIQCDTGERFVAANDDEGVCTECAAGLYQDETEHLLEDCKPCPIGTYRTEQGGKPLMYSIPVDQLNATANFFYQLHIHHLIFDEQGTRLISVRSALPMAR